MQNKTKMEKMQVERELSYLLELTIKLEDELNTLVRIED